MSKTARTAASDRDITAADMWRALITLVSMQLKEKIDLSFMKTGRSLISKTVFSVLGFVAVTALCYVFFFAAMFLKIFSMAGIIPASVLSVAFTFMLILSVLSCTAGLTKTLYFSRDNHMLLTMPVPAPLLYVSKLVVFYLYELVRNLSFMIPMFYAYGIISRLPFMFFVWVAFVFLFVSLIPVLVGALLSIPAMWLYQFLKQYRTLQLLVYGGAVACAVWGAVAVINIIPFDIQIVTEWVKISASIQQLLRQFEQNFSLFFRLTVLIAGKYMGLKYYMWTPVTLPAFGVLILSCSVLFSLGYLLAKPLFFKMASTPFEYRKRTVTKSYANPVLPARLSAFKKELILSLRTPDEIYTNLFELCGLPILLLLLNRIFSAIDTRDLGDYLIFSFNILIMLLFMLGSNVGMASVYSREGRAAYFTKTLPGEYLPLLMSKLYMRLIVTAMTAAAAAYVFGRECSTESPGGALFLGLGLFFISGAHIFHSAESDIMNPQTEQYGATGEHSKNPNETNSTVTALIVAILGALFAFLLFRENEAVCWVKFCMAGFVLLAFKVFTYTRKIKLYYKEK